MAKKKVVNRRTKEETDWMDHHEVAKLFGVQPRTVYTWIRTQKPDPNAPVVQDQEGLVKDLSKLPYRRTYKGLGQDNRGVPVIHFPRQAIYDILDTRSRVGKVELFQSGRQVSSLRCGKCDAPVPNLEEHYKQTHKPFRCKTCSTDVMGWAGALQHKSETGH